MTTADRERRMLVAIALAERGVLPQLVPVLARRLGLRSEQFHLRLAELRRRGLVEQQSARPGLHLTPHGETMARGGPYDGRDVR